jgi:hypothetical protein
MNHIRPYLFILQAQYYALFSYESYKTKKTLGIVNSEEFSTFNFPRSMPASFSDGAVRCSSSQPNPQPPSEVSWG